MTGGGDRVDWKKEARYTGKRHSKVRPGRQNVEGGFETDTAGLSSN